MSNTTPPAPETKPTPAPEASNFDQVVLNHGDEVAKFFGEAPAPVADDKKKSKPAATPTPEPEPSGEVGIDDILNIDDKKKAKPAAQTPAPEPEINIDELPEPDKNSKSRAGWEQLKALAKEERAKRATLETQLKELADKNVDKSVLEKTNARLAELERERNEFSEKVKVLDIQSHPEFIEKYVKPQQAAFENLKATLTEAAVEGFDFDAFKTATQKEQKEMLATVLPNLDPITQQDVVTEFKKLAAATVGAKEAIQNSSKTAEEFRSKLNATQKQVFDEVKASYKVRFHPIPTPEGAAAEEVARIEAYNKELQEVTARAETTALKSTSMADMAKAAIDASMLQFVLSRGLPRIQEVYSREIKTRDTKIAELTKQVNAMKKAQPSFQPGAGTSGDDDVVGQANTLDHASAVRAAYAR